MTLLDWRRTVFALYARVRAADDPAAAQEEWRSVRDQLFAHHPDSPLPEAARAAFTGLSYAAYDPAVRFEVPVDTDVEHRLLEVTTGTDGVVRFERRGSVELPGFGRLDLWWLLGYGGGLYLPVADVNPRTYGGGRYVLDTVKGADLGGDVDLRSGRGTLVVDLNFAYNPSCAYDPGWACPLAPTGNRLDVAVDAGELTPAG